MFDWRRWIGKPPKQAQYKNTDHRKSCGIVHEQGCSPRRTFRKNIVELTEEPGKDHQHYSDPMHHL
jgi:hypothetical protein